MHALHSRQTGATECMCPRFNIITDRKYGPLPPMCEHLIGKTCSTPGHIHMNYNVE